MGVAGGWVPGEGGDGTSMSGGECGVSGGASLGWPGCEGWGVSGDGVVGGAGSVPGLPEGCWLGFSMKVERFGTRAVALR
jgi:hypothetical protein